MATVNLNQPSPTVVVFRFITVRKRSLGQGNIFRSMCQEFCSRGGVLVSQHALRQTPPRDQAPPRPDTPLDQTPWTRHSPGPDTPPRDQAPPDQTSRTRHPPDRAPPETRHPPPQCMLGDTVNERSVCILLECNLV